MSDPYDDALAEPEAGEPVEIDPYDAALLEPAEMDPYDAALAEPELPWPLSDPFIQMAVVAPWEQMPTKEHVASKLPTPMQLLEKQGPPRHPVDDPIWAAVGAPKQEAATPQGHSQAQLDAAQRRVDSLIGSVQAQNLMRALGHKGIRQMSPTELEFEEAPIAKSRDVRMGQITGHQVETDVIPGTQIARQKPSVALDFVDTTDGLRINLGDIYEGYGYFIAKVLPIVGESVQLMAKHGTRAGAVKGLLSQSYGTQGWKGDVSTVYTDLILNALPDPAQKLLPKDRHASPEEAVKAAIEAEVIRHHGKQVFLKYLKEGASALPAGSEAAKEIAEQAARFGTPISAGKLTLMLKEAEAYPDTEARMRLALAPLHRMAEGRGAEARAISMLSEVMDRGTLPEKPMTPAEKERQEEAAKSKLLPDIYKTTVNTWRNVEHVFTGIGMIAYNVPKYVFSGLPIDDKVATTQDMGEHLVEYFTHRYGMLLKGNVGGFLEEGLLFALFDLALPFQVTRGMVQGAEVRALKKAAKLAGADSLLVERIVWTADDASLLEQAKKLSAEIRQERKRLNKQERIVSDSEKGRVVWGDYISDYEAMLKEFNELINRIHRRQDLKTSRGRITPDRRTEYDVANKQRKQALKEGKESLAENIAERMRIIEAESELALTQRLHELELGKTVTLERLEAGRGQFAKIDAESRAAKSAVQQVETHLEKTIKMRDDIALSLRPQRFMAPHAKVAHHPEAKILAEKAAILGTVADKLLATQKWLMPWGGMGSGIIGGAMGGPVGAGLGFASGGLVGLNALKNRLLRENSKLAKFLDKRGLRTKVAKDLDVRSITTLRHWFKDPDRLLPETVQIAMREAEGAQSAAIFALSDSLRALPKELWPEMRQFLHFEHEAVVKHFNWLEDSRGNITYQLKPEYAGNTVLEASVVHANKYAGPIASVIRRFATKNALEVGVFEHGEPILGRLWVKNMYNYDNPHGAINAIQDTVVGDSFRESILRKRGIPIEAREIPLGQIIPENIINKAKNPEARKLMRDRNASGPGGWGMTTDLVEELFVGVMQTIHDVNLLKSYKMMAADPIVASRIARPGWVKFPESTVPGLSVKKYGHLAGKWVNPDYAYFIKMQNVFAEKATGFWGKTLQHWKAGKTIFSPATHATNFLSNGLVLSMMADISPVNPLNWRFYAKAAKEFVAKGSSDLYREWIINGGKGRRGASQRSELVAEAESIAAQLHLGSMGQGKNFMMESLNNWRLTSQGVERIGNVHIGKRFYSKMGLIYQAGDDFYRFALYLKLRNKGVPPVEAALRGRKAFADYENLSGMFQVVKNSNFGIPFISFDARMAPQVAKWMRTSPLKGILLAQSFDFISQMNMAHAGVNLEQVRAYMRNLPWYQQQGYIPWVQFSGERLRPGSQIGGIGMLKYIPGARFVPLIDEMRKYGQGGPDEIVDPGVFDWLRRATLGNNPVMTSYAVAAFGYHPFYKKKLEGFGKDKLDYLAQLWIPNFPLIPWSWGDKRIQAAKEKRARLGRDDSESEFQAGLASWIGIRDIDYTMQEMLMTAADERDRRDIANLRGALSRQKRELISDIDAARRRRDEAGMLKLQQGARFRFADIIERMAEIMRKQMTERNIKSLKAFYEVH